METLFINTVSLKPTILFHRHNCTAAFLSRKRRNKVFCHISGNERTSNGVPSFATARSSAPSLAKNDTNKALMNVEGSVLLPNGKTQEEIAMQELIPCNGITTAFIDTRQEIGIVGFLKEKGFLITGATGFLAKVLVEKILRTEPNVGKIFLMIKAKNKEAAMERLHSEIIETDLFECLRKIHGKSYESFMLSKLVPVVGNVRQDNLGMEAKLADVIAGEVDVIINSAANTTFDERYDVALDINTQGPCRLMTFAKRCKKLKLFLHVSTAYVNGQRQGRVLEKPFCMGETIARERFTFGSSLNSLPHLDIEAEVKLAKACQENAAAHEMKEMGLERARVHGWQDTYVFTKAMGEMLINNMRGEIPVVIIRPSVIESTLREPFPGWMEGNRMMDPIILYYGKGQLTGFLVDPKGVIDVVPADMVVNATLAAMAKHGAAEQPGINIYHIASSVTNPLVFQDLASVLFQHFEAYPYMDSKGKPIQVQRMKLFHSMDDFSSHVWTDTIRRSGRGAGLYSPEMLSRKLENICKKSVEQIKYLANIYQPYTFYGGRFDNTNTQKLMENMSEEERKIFGFDVESIDWRDFISNIHIPGLRRHVMKGRGVGTKSRDEDSNAI